MNNKPKVAFNKGHAIFNLLLMQFVVFVFLVVTFNHFIFQSPYLLWQLFFKLIILITTIVLYCLYKRNGISEEQKAKYKLYLSGFIIFMIEIGILCSYLYLIGI